MRYSRGVVAAVLVLAVPLAAASDPDESGSSSEQQLSLEVSPEVDFKDSAFESTVFPESLTVEQELVLPYFTPPIDISRPITTEVLTGDGPIGVDLHLTSTSYVWTPISGEWRVGSVAPGFLSEGGRVNLSFAFVEGNDDVNEGLAKVVRGGDEGLSFMTSNEGLLSVTAPYVPSEARDAQHEAFESAINAALASPHVRYHYNTRHLAARILLDDESLDARVSTESRYSRSSHSAPPGHLATRAPDLAAPLVPVAPPAAPDASAGRPEATPQPTITSLRTLGVTAAATVASPTAVLIMGAAAAAAVVLIGLYSLFHSKDVLKSEIRRKIYDSISENPGITIVHLAETIGVRHQTVCYHLQLLKKGGYVTAHQKGNKVLHFVNGAGLNDAHRELLVVEPGSVTMRVLQEILRTPAIIKKDVAAATGLTRTGGAWHVNKLVKLGLVREEKRHGHCRLFPVEERIALLFRLRTETDVVEAEPQGIPMQGSPQDGPGFIHPT